MTGNRSAEPTSIVFGTDGWRARIADEYTFVNVRRCAQAVAEWVVARGEQSKGIVFAYDRPATTPGRTTASRSSRQPAPPPARRCWLRSSG